MKKVLNIPSLLRRGLTPPVLICVGLSGLGCLAIFNAAFHSVDPFELALRQTLWLIPATLVLLITAALPARRLPSIGIGGAAFFYLMLVAALFLGFGVDGTRGWLAWRGLLIQPGELAKPFFVLTLALIIHYTRKYRDDWFIGCGIPFLFLLVWLVPLLLQPDFGAVLVYLLTFSITFLCLGGSLRHLAVTLLAILPLLALTLRFAPLVMEPVQAVNQSSLSTNSTDWHVDQFKHALASGGLFGRTLGQTLESPLALPPDHSTSIFATLGEALGLVGLTSLLLIMMAWVVYGWRCGTELAYQETDEFRVAGIVGLTSLLAVQACLHLSTNLGLLPQLDLQLPFLSYGANALLTVFITVGLVESLYRHGE